MLPSRWSHLARYGLLGTSLVAAASGNARADSCNEVAEGTVAFVLGVQLAPNTRLVGGIEARRCLSNKTEALVRFELGGGSPRLIGGARARPFEQEYEENDLELVGAEAGLLVDFQSRFGLHLAGTYGTHSAYAAFQGHVTLGEPALPARLSIVGGLAPWTLGGGSEAVPGRPLIEHGAMLRPRIARPLAPLAAAEERDVRDHFVSAAQLELSSVLTFLRLAAELAVAGAPRELIAAALDAADDEVRHAELCAKLAGGIALAALPTHVAQPRFTKRSASALALLAAEAWCEGCLNETAAAEEARIAAEFAHGDAKPALAAIARDERGHAELSWAVLAWLHATAPDAVAAALASIPPAALANDAHVDAALSRFGVPTVEVTAAARAHAEVAARSRLAGLVA